MKKIALLVVVLAAAAGGAKAVTEWEKLRPYLDSATRALERAQHGVEANPVPVVIALGTFLLTFVYHKAKGKTFRESVEVAATRVTVVPAPAPQPAVPENVVLKRAQARATRSQLLADQVEIRTRIAKLPDAVTKAEKDACYAEKAVNDLKAVLGEKHKTRNLAVDKLEGLRRELAAGERELAEIEAELKKLAEVA